MTLVVAMQIAVLCILVPSLLLVGLLVFSLLPIIVLLAIFRKDN